MRRKSVPKKDNLFAASRFVLPEHREWYLQMKEEEGRWLPPELDGEQRAALSERLWQAFQLGREAVVTVAGDQAPLRLAGRVLHLDPAGRELKLRTGEGTKRVRFDALLDVELP